MRIASTISPLQTPWQLHTRALSGRSAAVAWRGLGEQRERVVGLAAGAHRVDQQLGAAGVAEQDRADRAAVARRRSACGSVRVVGDDDRARAVGRARA